MSEKKEFEYGLQEENEMTVTLTLDDDSELECAVIAIFPVQGKDYIAMRPLGEENPRGVYVSFLTQRGERLAVGKHRGRCRI